MGLDSAIELLSAGIPTLILVFFIFCIGLPIILKMIGIIIEIIKMFFIK